jgi:hypothetical protein
MISGEVYMYVVFLQEIVNLRCWAFYFDPQSGQCEVIPYKGEVEDFWMINSDCIMGPDNTKPVLMYIRRNFNIHPYTGAKISHMNVDISEI